MSSLPPLMGNNARRANDRRIFIIGLKNAMQGNDGPAVILRASNDLNPENIVATTEAMGYSPQTADKFTQDIIDSGVLFRDELPPQYEDAPPADDRDEDIED